MNKSRFYFAILLLALVLRVAWALAVPVQPVSDGHAYDVFAQNLVSGSGFGWLPGQPTAYWAPGASFVYAVLFILFGHTYVPIVILNIALGVFVVGAAMQLAEWWFNRRVSLVTGLVLGLWPNLIEFTTLLATELLFCALLLAALLAWTHPAYGWRRRAVGAGVLLAGACYVRPIALALPVVFLALEWLRARGQPEARAGRRSLAAAALLGIVLVVGIAPWSVRNTFSFGRFVLTSTNGGLALWFGNNAASDGEAQIPLPPSPYSNEADQDAYLTSLVLGYVGSHPIEFGIGILKKLALTYDRESIGVVWNELGLAARWGEATLVPLKIINAAYWYLVLALALAGFLIVFRRNGWRSAAAQPPVWLWAYFALTQAVILAQDRYHIPSNPAIAMMAAYVLVYTYDAWWARVKLRVSSAAGIEPRAGAGPEIAERVEV